MSRWRTVQVFLSSTFRDMQAERDQLVRQVFPALRERLLPYRVELIDVDLRWGITEEQARDGRVIGLCLDQIAQCELFFGFLGERYGWTPEQTPPSTVQQHPWLAGLRGLSVTELELRWALLDRDAPKPGALALRTTTVAASVPAAAQQALFVEPDAAARANLDQLKQRLRDFAQRCHYPLLDPYPCRWDGSAEDRSTRARGRLTALDEFGCFAEEQLWQAVRGLLKLPDQPHAAPSDPLDDEAELHQRFAEMRARLYTGRQTLNDALHAYARGGADWPCLVVGQSGSGKSAALADFATTFAIRHPDAFVLPHFVGASPRSSNLRDLLGRLCGELQRQFGLSATVPDSPAERARMLGELLQQVPQGKRCVLVIDALNQLERDDGAWSLHWLPERLPPHVKIVVSCLDEPSAQEILSELERRGCRRWERRVESLTDAERAEIIRRVPRVSAKTLDTKQLKLLLAKQATRNPLYLLTSLEELRGHGSYEGLNALIAELPDTADPVTDLFQFIFARLEPEFGTSLVRSTLSLLACARRGLTEAELRALTAADGGEELFPLLRQLRPYLLSRAGRLSFYHANLVSAVVRRYIKTDSERRVVHQRLADYFAAQPLSTRQVEEWPWQLARAQNWPQLAQVLTHPDFLVAAWRHNEFEVRTYWADVERSSKLRLAEAYQPVVNDPSSVPFAALAIVFVLLKPEDLRGGTIQSQFDRERREFETALYGRCMEEGQSEWFINLLVKDAAVHGFDEGPNFHETLLGETEIGRNICLVKQARLHHRRGEVDTALRLLADSEAVLRRGQHTEFLVGNLRLQARYLASKGDRDRGLALAREAEQLCRPLKDPRWATFAWDAQAEILKAQGDRDGAWKLRRKEEAVYRQVNNRPALALNFAQRARLLEERGMLDSALKLLQEQEKLHRAMHHDQPRRGDRLFHGNLLFQALLLEKRREFDRALALLGELERLLEFPALTLSFKGKDYALLVQCLGTQAGIRQAQGDLDAALALREQQEQLCRKHLLVESWVLALSGFAALLQARGDLDGALAKLREQERLCRRLPDEEKLQTCLEFQASLHSERGSWAEALPCLQEAERLCRTRNDPAGLARLLGFQGVGLQNLEQSEAALRAQQECARLCRQLQDNSGLAEALLQQAMILRDQGDAHRALEVLREQETASRTLTDKAPLRHGLDLQVALLLELGQLDEAFARVVEVDQLWRASGDDAGMCAWLELRGLLLRQRGDLAGALAAHEEAERLARRLPESAQPLASDLHNQATILIAQGEDARAEPLLQEHETLCRQLGRDELLAVSLMQRGLLLMKRREVEAAAPLIHEAEELFGRLGNTAGLAQVAQMRAILAQLRGSTPAPEEPPDTEEFSEELVRQWCDHAGALLAQGDADGALAVYQQVEQACRAAEFMPGLCHSLEAQALFHINQSDDAAALPLLQELESYFLNRRDLAGLCRTRINLAMIQRACNNPLPALNLLREVEDLARHLDDPECLTACLANQALILGGDLQQFQQALPCAEEALALACRHGQMERAAGIAPLVEQLRQLAGRSRLLPSGDELPPPRSMG